MKLIVQRETPTSLSVIGQLSLYTVSLSLVNECYTLEPPYKTDGSKPRAIPAGTYPLTIRLSARFKRLMPHVENVPGFTEVEIHWGNYPKDTEACTLVGSSDGINFVSHSVMEFNILFLQIQDGMAEGPATITYLDPPEVLA